MGHGAPRVPAMVPLFTCLSGSGVVGVCIFRIFCSRAVLSSTAYLGEYLDVFWPVRSYPILVRVIKISGTPCGYTIKYF
eukprot:SAG11_NODE_1944_length_4019_cov_2.495792_1_plen_79_part_00